MADDVRVTNPVSIESDSKARVAFDMMMFIGEHVEAGDKSNREYWLTLYSQCHKAASGQLLKYVLNRAD
jgi:hypothetical protein